ncbi:hypothetical protein EVAR_66411_1 [Eumeta japonica]|uniref:Uncharacterized protein n=1 Tax=Eumeta variegata TaxID=151549 RepID=A0A4C2A6M2_EUMVA|nr:hypothetical protein EVAR_66411_1 [Eumeta japonica]
MGVPGGRVGCLPPGNFMFYIMRVKGGRSDLPPRPEAGSLAACDKSFNARSLSMISRASDLNHRPDLIPPNRGIWLPDHSSSTLVRRANERHQKTIKYSPSPIDNCNPKGVPSALSAFRQGREYLRRDRVDGGDEEEWTIGTLTHCTNSESCNFMSVFYESVISLVRRRYWLQHQIEFTYLSTKSFTSFRLGKWFKVNSRNMKIHTNRWAGRTAIYIETETRISIESGTKTWSVVDSMMGLYKT